MQYLQTLGFIPIQGRNSAARKLYVESHIIQGILYGKDLVTNCNHSVLSPLQRAQGGKPDGGEPERLRHISGTSLLSSSSSQSGNSMGVTFNNVSRRVREDSGGEEQVFYLQRSLLGGIILFEVGLCEPFFYAKIHTLEVTRIQSRKSRNGFAYQVRTRCIPNKIYFSNLSIILYISDFL